MVQISAPAKVNLFLAILSKDESGYHLLDTVFARVPELADVLEVEPAEELTFECNVFPGEDNTVMKALRLLEQKTGRRFTYKIRLIKNIPLQSGLGGGSSDAAAILLYLNETEKLGFTREELMELGAHIGMDVPFFLSGYDVARGTHYGEILEPLPPLPSETKLEIGFTNIPVSTKEAFAEWDKRGLRSNAPKYTPGVLHNDFEQIFPDLSFKKPNNVLTGSGGAYVTISS